MPGGRPSKLTPQTSKLLLDAIKLGATYADAAAYAGIAYNTFNEWVKKGEVTARGQYAEFYEALTHARAQGKVALLAKIEKAATDGDWRAAAWKLERRDPEGYGSRLKLTGDAEHPVVVKTLGDLLAIPDGEPGGERGDAPA